ncbi:MAG: pyridoxal phosphate-dependent aminotransferase [Gemmatimonadota bacterium]
MEFSANVQQLKPSETIAVNSLAKRLQAEGRDIINLGAGEPDFDTPAWMSQAAIEGIHAGQTHYTAAPGMPELRQAIADSYEHRGRTVEWSQVVVSAGAKQSLFNACFTLFGPGDEVLIAAPYWTTYPALVHLARAEPVTVAGSEELDFRLRPEDLDGVATDRTRGLILCSPSNPTGTVYSLDELRAVAEWARDRDVWLISDEIYRLIYHGDDRDSAPSVVDLDEGSLGPHVIVDGVSKCFAMTGWRIGYTVSDAGLAGKMAALQSQTTSNPASPSQLATLAAFTQPERAAGEVATMLEAFRRRRDLVVGLVRDLLPEVGFVQPRGAFYLFFRVDSFFDDEVPDSSAFCTWLLEKAGVAVVPGSAFGDDRYVRMSFASSDDVLESGIRRIAEAVAARKSG